MAKDSSLKQSQNRTRIKCCGLRRREDISMVNAAGVDFAGFILSSRFWRYVEPSEAARLHKLLAPGIQAVGVFVDEPPEYVAGLLLNGTIDIAQLHGSEDDAYISSLRGLLEETPAGRNGCTAREKPAGGESRSGYKIIKAFKIRTAEDIEKAVRSSADYILLDSGTGTGLAFDWSLMTDIARPYFFAGGLEPGNVAEAVSRFHPFAVDVSSGIETDRLKDASKIAAFAENVRKASAGECGIS